MKEVIIVNYTVEDIKSMGLRVSKLINHDLQRSKMNKNLKPYFTENSVNFFNRNGQIGIALNNLEIDNTSALEEIGAERYTNNLALITETVNKCLRRTGMDEIFELSETTKHPDTFKYGNSYKPKYLQCSLVLKEEAQAVLPSVKNASSTYQMQNDLDKINSNITGYTGTKTLWKSPADELRDELNINSTIEANRYDKKITNIDNNSNSYPELYYTDLNIGMDLDFDDLDLEEDEANFNEPESYEYQHDIFKDENNLVSESILFEEQTKLFNLNEGAFSGGDYTPALVSRHEDRFKKVLPLLCKEIKTEKNELNFKIDRRELQNSIRNKSKWQSINYFAYKIQIKTFEKEGITLVWVFAKNNLEEVNDLTTLKYCYTNNKGKFKTKSAYKYLLNVLRDLNNK